ncbi:MAG TPA: RHS repeat protein, partial [Polyangiaceae bacterium]|nr:RHS repeat protein [Polyangiaceae bacterium]
RFRFLEADGETTFAQGFTLTRVAATEYHVSRHAQPTRVFRAGASREWPVCELRQNDSAVRVERDESQLVSAVWIDEDRALRFRYDDARHLERIRLYDRNRQEPIELVRYRYDAAGCLEKVVDVYKQTIAFEYDEHRRMVRHADTSGFAFLFQYDHFNRCFSSAGEDGLLSVTLTFRPEAFETELLDANGAVWLYQYDPSETLLRIVDPYGDALLFERDAQGRLVAEIDSAGRRTEYLHDAAGAQVAKRLPDGTVVQLPHPRDEPEHPPHRVPSSAIEWEYGDLGGDEFGLPDSLELRGVLPAAVHSILVTSEHPLRGKVEEKYNEAGLLTRGVLEDGRKRRYGYTARGKVRRYRDFDGSDYKLETRSWDLPHILTDPLGNATQFDYTQTAELQEAIDPAGNTIHYGYDLKDRLSTITRDVFLHDRYEYDGSDNLTAKYDGNGRQLLALEYDGHNRLVRRELIGSDEHRFEYDERGWVTKAKTQLHTTRFAWDYVQRRLKDERDGRGVQHRFTGVDLAQTTVLGRFTTEYHRVHGETTIVVDPSGGTHRLRRHGRGVFTRDYNNGLSETAQYSPRGWCLGKTAYATDKPDAAWTRRYDYSGEGDLTRVIDTERGVTQHAHDAAHRLVGTTHSDGRRDTYRYTKSGSLLEKPGLTDTTVGHLNQLRYAAGHRFEYGVRQHVSKHTAPNGAELEFRYDARDQLVAASVNGQPFFSAEYDAIGRRIEKTVRGETTTYYWDGDRLAAEVRPDGQLRVYVYPDAFAMVPLLFIDYTSVDAEPESGQRYYLFCDQRGCPERVVDEQGETVWEAYVEPYGTAHVRVGQDFYQPLRFPGHFWDAELGLHYNRFRYYSPWLGRYLQVDPIGEGGGWNVYGYPFGPSAQVDVDGLTADCGDENEPPERRLRRRAGDRGDAQQPGSAAIPRHLQDAPIDALRRYVDRRAAELQRVFASVDPEGERRTTLSVGVTEDSEGRRRVVVTTSDDAQELDPRVKAALEPHEQFRPTEPTLTRGRRRPNPDYDPSGPVDRRRNPRTITDSQMVDPDTGARTPYRKARRGSPVEGTQHHAEQRMIRGARDNGEAVLAQAPTRKCCSGCRQVLGTEGLAGIPQRLRGGS